VPKLRALAPEIALGVPPRGTVQEKTGNEEGLQNAALQRRR
jgi:hypothetical protein